MTTKADTTAAVDAFMAKLDHPHKDAIEELRAIILGAHASIAEGVKWNAPSFRTTEYFATTHLRTKGGVGLILHLGAKVKDNSTGGATIDDPGKLLQWLAKERAMITFADRADLEAKKAKLAAIVKQWVRMV
ncbi:DUF1801 domain-containing protein [Usitatibacter palustris]|uniref:YdhG-like domain-containing protein n=1 Tax=Usitatibacter palustris TaxID=2732487 RepID=A0A6M4HCV2_9PROT|nr:DUF1801 domain-containing protein [Usitatibacter palustris]QJR15827.1 hypothetical protein DSM104440_02653 [Usitatibacter palustris]